MSRGKLESPTRRIAMSMLEQDDFTQLELRLLPYIQYQLMNSQNIDPSKINQEEREILQKWRDAGHITFGMSELTCTKVFWQMMHEVLWHSYVANRWYNIPHQPTTHTAEPVEGDSLRNS